MANLPAVTVISPTKNRQALLKEAVASVRAQTFSDWEHIIVDDGSDDGTLEMMAAMVHADSRIRFLERQGMTGGANICRNQGLAAARGEFVVFLDSDDLLDPHCIGKRVDVMRRNLDLDFATFATSVFIKTRGDVVGRGADNHLFGDDLLRFLYFELPWIITAPIWRRSALEHLGGFEDDLPSWQDVDLHLRAVSSGMKYLRFSDVDHHVRWQWEDTKVSVEQRRSPDHLKAGQALIAKFETLIYEGPGINWVRQRALCSLYFFFAERWIDIGKLRHGLRCWKQVQVRELGPKRLFIPGAIILVVRSFCRSFGERVGHKWKGWARLRTNPELVSGRHRRVEN